MSTYIQTILWKKDEIKMQFFDIHSNELFILTQAKDLSWTLYNHTQNKKIGSSVDATVLLAKIPNYHCKGGD
jgi:hypothetical protein